MESIVKVEGVSKHYGSVQALDDVSFEVRPGEIFGLIGPDGAGKSTLFRMLATLLCPESGWITVDGLDVVGDYRKLRACVGYMPGRFSLYPDLTVEENLNFLPRCSVRPYVRITIWWKTYTSRSSRSKPAAQGNSPAG